MDSNTMTQKYKIKNLKLYKKLQKPKKNLNLSGLLTKDCIEEVFKCMNLSITMQLSMCSNYLIHIPSNFGNKATNILYLDLSNNNLRYLPNSFELLSNLEILYLDKNKFNNLPYCVYNLKKLKELSISSNILTQFSQSACNLLNLEVLNLSNNHILTLPSEMKSLNNLKNVYMANNKLKSVPICIKQGLNSLEILDLSKNEGLDISIEPKSINLKVFYAKNNRTCPIFPSWIFSPLFPKLEEVSLDNTQFTHHHLLNNISTSRLRILSMVQCHLSNIDLDKIAPVLENVEYLSIGNNKAIVGKNSYWYFPVLDLKNYNHLKELDIKEVDISILPPEINKFVNLTKLNISGNLITWLPDTICNLKKLESLLVEKNGLAYLPEQLGDLSMLKELNARNNYLSSIPDSIKSLSNLIYIDLYGNDFKEFPKQIHSINLSGLDIDQNLFSTDSLKILDKSYEKLRNTLRNHWVEEDKITGYRVESNVNTDCDDSSGSNKDNKSSSEYEQWDKNKVFEDWNISDNSADEFDPTENVEPKTKCILTVIKLANQRLFCPADIHALPTSRIIEKMLKNGILDWRIKIEEGQFEDA